MLGHKAGRAPAYASDVLLHHSHTHGHIVGRSSSLGQSMYHIDKDVVKAIGGNVRAVEKIGFPKQFLVNTWEP